MTHGCHDRPEYREVLPVQDGWFLDGTTRTPRMVAMKFRMERSCQYTHTDAGKADAGCDGCRWRAGA